MTVRAWSDPRTLSVQIVDQGGGFDAEAALAAGVTSGVSGMRERAGLLGGHLTVESAVGKGTRVSAELPVNDARARRHRRGERMAVRIMLADDHPVVRLGIRNLLEAEPGFEIVGEVADALQVIPQVEALQPDVLVLDLIMPGLNGLEITRQLARRAPQTHIIVLSMHANEAYVIEALRNGASGYVLKGSDAGQLVQAIREVLAGRRYLSPPLSEHAIEMYIEKAAGGPLDPYETLSAREREVLHFAAEGHTSPEIAARLYISTRTVESHRASLMRKLGLRSQTDLVRYALRRGILTLEE